MCKKNRSDKNTEVVREKSLSELTDGEYLERVEKLGTPLYLDYLTAPRFENVTIDGYLSKTDIGILADNATTSVAVKNDTRKQEVYVSDPKRKVYDKKRGFFAFLVTFLSLILAAAASLGVAGYEAIAKYVAMFTTEGQLIGMVDPVMSGVEYFVKLGLTTVFIKYFDGAVSTLDTVIVYAVTALVLIYLICVLIAFIKGMAAMFSRRDEDGYYKKYRFGLLGFLMLIFALLITVGAWYMNYGFDMSTIMDYILPSEKGFAVGYALYAMIVIPILFMIFSGVMFRRKK